MTDEDVGGGRREVKLRKRGKGEAKGEKGEKVGGKSGEGRKMQKDKK